MPPLQGPKKVKIDLKMKKLFRKRARECNSDGDEYEVDVPAAMGARRSLVSITNKNNEDDRESEEPCEDEGAAGEQKVWNKNVTDMNNHVSEDEREDYGEILPRITKFTQGCRAFNMAFRNIINKSVSDDSLGPVLSGHKKIIVDKLAEEEAERKIKGEAKKEKYMLAEKGHVKPVTYVDSNENFLLSVATKGVVQCCQQGTNCSEGVGPSMSKDAKVSLAIMKAVVMYSKCEIRKRTKEAFFSEKGKPSLPAIGTSAKANASTGKVDSEEPAWAPLRDNYMLTSSRLKAWDKMPDKNVSNNIGKMSEDSSSDED